MTKIILKLLAELYTKKIDPNDFFNQLNTLTGIKFSEDFCISKLEEGISFKDSETIDLFISIGFMKGFTEKAVPIMCKLLLTDLHHKHEDIAFFLQDFDNDIVIDALYEAAQMNFEYLNYDDTNQLARKCIKSLSKIGTRYAREKLLILANSPVQNISNYARRELK